MTLQDDYRWIFYEYCTDLTIKKIPLTNHLNER
jgi:hypothetical protein